MNNDGTNEFTERQKRYKIVYLDEADILSLFCITAGSPVAIQVPILRGDLPIDVEIIAIFYDHLRDAFAFKLWALAWPVVPDGSRIPTLDDVKIEKVCLNADQVGKIRSAIPPPGSDS
jgi:hypothetical protein